MSLHIVLNNLMWGDGRDGKLHAAGIIVDYLSIGGCGRPSLRRLQSAEENVKLHLGIYISIRSIIM